MKKTIIKNEKIIRSYREWLKEAKGFSEITVEQKLRPIRHYQKIFDNEDFSSFNTERATKFKFSISNLRYNEQPIKDNSYRAYLNNTKSFFQWLCIQPGYRNKIKMDTIEYLNITKRESRIAAQPSNREYPTIEYIIELVKSIVVITEIDMRDRALIAFMFLTGIRDAALISLPIKCVDEEKLIVFQDPRSEVKTKFSKFIISKIFKFDNALLEIALDWIKYLKSKRYSPDYPVFPRSKTEQVENGYSFIKPTKVEPLFFKNTLSIREILKSRCKEANLQYYSPHCFRHSCFNYARKLASSGDELAAIAENFGHESVKSIFMSYGKLSPEQQIEILDLMENKNINSDQKLYDNNVLKQILMKVDNIEHKLDENNNDQKTKPDKHI
jgi:integrase